MYPFEVESEQLERTKDAYIDSFVSTLRSFFELMPRGEDFIGFPKFAAAYLALSEETKNFDNFTYASVLSVIKRNPLALVVVRSILGFSPPEFASAANKTGGTGIDQSSARRIDKRAREGRDLLSRTSLTTQSQVQALVRTAVDLIHRGAPSLDDTVLHRLDKIDTKEGIESLRRVARGGVPYDALLYERYLGRPFATHRDAVSEKVGGVLEDAVEARLKSFNVPYYKAGVAERFEDMDQAPDFFVPDASRPSAVIEAKLAEDDGTARDKVTRIQHLGELRDERIRRGEPAFEVIACVDGRGFGIRRERVWALLQATRGKLFTLQTIDRLTAFTSLREFVIP